MTDRKSDNDKRPPECERRDPHKRACPHLKEIDPTNMSGETYDCQVCGEHYFLDYEEMK